MGMLMVRTWGSFRMQETIFKAQSCGHAVAVDDAITFLEKFKKEARKQDKQLREEGHAPDDDFAEADKRGLLNED